MWGPTGNLVTCLCQYRASSDPGHPQKRRLYINTKRLRLGTLFKRHSLGYYSELKTSKEQQTITWVAFCHGICQHSATEQPPMQVSWVHCPCGHFILAWWLTGPPDWRFHWQVEPLVQVIHLHLVIHALFIQLIWPLSLLSMPFHHSKVLPELTGNSMLLRS